MRTQYSTPPTHRADSLAHNQSEYPMAQTADSQPPQTSHVESDQTMSEWLRKLPTKLNTPNILVADLVWVSSASDVQRLVKHFQETETNPVAYDTALTVTMTW